MAQDVATLFRAYSRKKLLEQYWPRLRGIVEPLTNEQLWWRPNEASNSIGNLLLHLNGNVRQWLVDSFNGQVDERNRPLEFSEREGISAADLLTRLGATLDEASKVLNRLTADELVAPMEIQGYHVTGLDAVYQVVEHFGLHYGQILYIVKMLTGEDLKLYRELNESGRSDESAAHP
jgi:hypothetical protein